MNLKEIKSKLYTVNEYGVEYQNSSARLDQESIEWLEDTYGIETDVHRSCINCQARQLIKYDGRKDPKGVPIKEFRVPCKFIQNKLAPGSAALMRKMVSEDKIDPVRAELLLKSTVDPVAWASMFFGFSDSEPTWNLRPYQKEQLRCTSEKIVIREGRRSGKALPLDTPIPTPSGWTTMGDIAVGDQVFGPDGLATNVTFVTPTMYNHDLYKIEFDDKSSMVADAEHQWTVSTRSSRRRHKQGSLSSPYFTCTTKDIVDGSLRIGKKKPEYNYRIELSKPVVYNEVPSLDVEPYVLGYWLGDGVRGTGRITIGLEDQEESCSRIKSFGYKMRVGGYDSIDCNIYGLSTKLLSLGVRDEKRVPTQYLRAAVEDRWELLRGLMDSDGSVDESGHSSYCTVDDGLADDFYELACSLGLKVTRTIGDSYLNGVKHRPKHRFYFNTNQRIFNLARKQKRIDDTAARRSVRNYRAIVSTEASVSVPVRCITVDNERHLYLAGRQFLVTHNTFIIALKLLHLAFTREVQRGRDADTGEKIFSGPEIMVVTPFSSQLLNIFDEMEKLLKRSADLMKRSTSTNGSMYVKTPYFHMDFDNGAIINGFVSGVATKVDGSGGGTMRGRNANIIYLDEMDMIPAETLNKVVLPILLTDQLGEVQLIATSTPIGKRDKFYEWCFPPETLLETSVGYDSIRSIIDRHADVLDGCGRTSTPSGNTESDYDGPLIRIKPHCRPLVSCTPGHPVWADGKWVKAHELRKGMSLFVPKPEVLVADPVFDTDSMNTLIDDSFKTNHVKLSAASGNVARYCRENDLCKRKVFRWMRCFNDHGVVSDIRKINGVSSARSFFDRWTSGFDDLDARALGLYLAEGSVVRTILYHTGIKWTFNCLESEYIDVVKSWAIKHGFTPLVSDRSDIDSTVDVVINCSWLGRLFELEVGISHNKKIPLWFRPEFTQPLLQGLLDGDGYTTKYSRWTVSLTALSVLTRLDQLLRSTGVLPSLSFQHPDGKKPLATLRSQAGRYCKPVDGGWAVTILELDDVDYRGPVFNLEIPGSNDYSVGFKVHNCVNDPTYKEDHLPSTVLPQWEKNKVTYETEGSSESFRSEYMAEFIDASYGVFKPGYVYACMKDYSYEQCQSPRWWRDFARIPDKKSLLTCIGIDWNKNAGTEFVVVQYDTNSHKFIIVETVNVSASEFSSIKWKEEVIRLNYKWKPNYIYADEGYGHTIIEDLKVLSFQVAAGPKNTRRDVETAKIKDRLVSFNFSSKVKLRSPIDGIEISKSGKDFLVEYAVRCLEDGILWMPESEDTLRKQMLNYVVLRRSPTTNKPVYGAENANIGDHRLDALMLALAGIQLENGLYSGNSVSESVPKFMSREFLAKREQAEFSSPGRSVLDILSRTQVAAPAHVKMMQSMRQGETPEQAYARNPDSEARIPGRSRGRVQEAVQSVGDWLRAKAGASSAGYADDTEHLYESEPSPSVGIVVPRRGRAGRRSIRRRR